MTELFVSVSRFIPAVPHEVFELLATPTMHRAIDGSGSVRGAATGPERLFLGAEFGMQMKIAASYRSLNTVTEFVEGELIAWQPKGKHIWRYRLTAVEGGRASIGATLERLAHHFA